MIRKGGVVQVAGVEAGVVWELAGVPRLPHATASLRDEAIGTTADLQTSRQTTHTRTKCAV